MNILILMAGNNAAFEEAGYIYPKNLVDINGLPLVQRVLENLSVFHREQCKFICLIREEENKKYYTGDVIRLLVKDATVLEVNSSTAGAACTALLAIEQINNDVPLLIASGDQIITEDLADIVKGFQERNLDGGIPIFQAVHPRWSYVKCSEEGLVTETSEKRPISDLATVGVYYFAKGSTFVSAAMEMIKKDAQLDGNFYICPVYNQMILKQAKIGIHQLPKNHYFKLSTPQEMQLYKDYLYFHQRQVENPNHYFQLSNPEEIQSYQRLIAL